MAWHPALRLEIQCEFSRLQREHVTQRVLDALEARRWYMRPRLAARRVSGRPPVNRSKALRAHLRSRANRRWSSTRKW
jgi:hypothetical protein